MTDPIQTVMARLGDELGGLGTHRASMLTEVRDGLEDAATAYANAGLPEVEARHRAATDFGDPGLVARHYGGAELGRRSRQAAWLLGAGPVLVLIAWFGYGSVWGDGRVGPSDVPFVLITAVCLTAGLLGSAWVRRQLRDRLDSRGAALGVGVTMLGLCVITWLLSYRVNPWTTPADVLRTGWQPVYAVEAMSMLVTAAMCFTAVRCLTGLRRA